MKRILIIIIIMISALQTFSQSAGNSGLSFLKNGFGAKNIAMSDLGVVGNNDVTSLFYNPANLAKINSSEILLSHNELIQDAKSELLGASFRLFNVPFAIGLNTTKISDFEYRSKPGEPSSKFDINYFYTSISTGFNVYNSIDFGVTAKYVYEGYLSDEATGWGFDFGLSYNEIIKNLDFGISLRNLGSMSVLRRQSTEMPTDLRAGFSYDYDIKSANILVQGILGLQKYTSTEDTHIHAGADLTYKNDFSLRIGYMTGYESKGITFGGGVKWRFMKFDYAYTPFTFDLGSSHNISLIFGL